MAAPSLARTTALILCGGLGTRLREVLGSLPKALAPIAGRPFLAFQLSFLRHQGIREVVLCTGHAADQVEASCQDGSALGLDIRYSRESQPLGTAGALRLARAQIRSDPFLVFNGDTFVGADLASLLVDHQSHGARVTLGVVAVPDLSRFGAVTLSPTGEVSAFGEKGNGGPGCINAGLYVMNRDVLDALPVGKAVSLEHEVFPAFVGKGLRGMRVAGPFLDIGTEETYRQAEDFLTHWPGDAAT